MAWRWVHKQHIFIFGWIIPLKLVYLSTKTRMIAFKMALVDRKESPIYALDTLRSIDLHLTLIEHCKFNSPENVCNFWNRNRHVCTDTTGLFTSADVYCCMTIKTLLMTNCPFRIGGFITCELTCKFLPVMTEPTTHIKVCTSLPVHLRPYEFHSVENVDGIAESRHKYGI